MNAVLVGRAEGLSNSHKVVHQEEQMCAVSSGGLGAKDIQGIL